MTDESAYQIEPTERGFEIVSPAGYVKVVCATEEQARLYLDLMSDAYRSGYRDGYRAARRQ